MASEERPVSGSTDLGDQPEKGQRRWQWAALGISLLVVLVTLIWPHAEVSAQLDHLGRAVCGQLPEHSFTCGERQLPLCARCTGTYLAALVTYLALGLMGRGRADQLPSLNILLVLGMFIALWALDGFNSYATLIRGSPLLYEPDNLWRLISGLLQGMALMVIVRPIVAATVWAETKDIRIIRGYGELFLLILSLVGLALLVRTEAAWLYYPLALTSVAGEVLILTLVNTLVAFLLFRRDSPAGSWREVAWLWALGLAAALIEINLISYVHDALQRVLGLPL